MEYFYCYLVIISAVAAVITVYDKAAAKKYPRNRVPENVLILIALLGGSVSEYIVMLAIRHKTRHKKFMVGLPLIIVLQAAALLLSFYKFL